jgi:hypothetical protein
MRSRRPRWRPAGWPASPSPPMRGSGPQAERHGGGVAATGSAVPLGPLCASEYVRFTSKCTSIALRHGLATASTSSSGRQCKNSRCDSDRDASHQNLMAAGPGVTQAGSGHGTGGNSVRLKQVSEVRSIGSASKDLQRCRLGVHMHGPSWSGWSGSAVGGPGSPHSDSVFRSNKLTGTNRPTGIDRTRFGWRRGVVHLHSPLPARSRQAGATIRRGRPFAEGEPRHLQRQREHLAAARIHTPPGRQARRQCSIPQRYFSMAMP